MKYDDFKSLVCFMEETNLEISKDELKKILRLNTFNDDVKEILLLLNDQTIKNRSKWIDMLLKYGNDTLAISSLHNILKTPYIRENDAYVYFIMTETNLEKRTNLIRALSNLKILGNFQLFRFIFNIEDVDKQRRIVTILEYDIGYSKFKEIPLEYVTAYELNYTLVIIEQAIMENEKTKVEEMTKIFIENPTKENTLLLAQHLRELEKTLAHYSIEPSEVCYAGDDALTDEANQKVFKY